MKLRKSPPATILTAVQRRTTLSANILCGTASFVRRGRRDHGRSVAREAPNFACRSRCEAATRDFDDSAVASDAIVTGAAPREFARSFHSQSIRRVYPITAVSSPAWDALRRCNLVACVQSSREPRATSQQPSARNASAEVAARHEIDRRAKLNNSLRQHFVRNRRARAARRREWGAPAARRRASLRVADCEDFIRTRVQKNAKV